MKAILFSATECGRPGRRNDRATGDFASSTDILNPNASAPEDGRTSAEVRFRKENK